MSFRRPTAAASVLLWVIVVALAGWRAGSAGAIPQERSPLSTAVRAFVKVDASVIALTNTRLIDGTGAAARERQTVVIRDGTIDSVRERVGLR